MAWPWRRRKTFDSPPRPIDQMWLDMLGRGNASPVGRTEALSVPAVVQGRNAICAIATLPLEQLGPDNAVVENALLRQFDPDVPNVTHLSQTVEDLIFDSIGWWLITSSDFAGFPSSVRHLDAGTVSLQPPATGQNPAPLPSGVDPRGGVVWVDGKPVDKSRIIRFDSPNPPLTKVGARAIRRAIELDRAASRYANDPRPSDYFTPADGADPVDDDEILDILRKSQAARKQRATAYIPAALKYNTVDSPSPRELQLVELQKQVGVEIANLFGLDSEDLGVSTTSRTYSNAIDRRRDRINDTLAPFMRAVTDRLSMGDVTRRGYRVVFQLDDFMKANPTERWATYQTAKNMGVMTAGEIRAAEGLPPLPADAEVSTDTQVPDVVDAARPAAVTFDGPGLTFADVPVVEFSVDRQGRVIEGLVIPWGKLATQAGMKFRFERGALQWDAENPGRVKLLRDHDTRTPLGKAIQLKDTPQGMRARFKVARGAAGDEALELAEDGVLDGLSVGVDFDMSTDTAPDPRNKGALLVRRADWRETSLTAMPSFDDARVTSVAASRTGGGPVPDTEESTEATEATETPAAQPVTFSLEQVQAMLTQVGLAATPAATEAPTEGPTPVDPTRPVTLSLTREALPYTFDRGGNFIPTEHVFSVDLHEMALSGDSTGESTDAGKRVMGLLRATFADTTTGDVNELNPTINRPDMYVDQQDFKYPIWNAISKGAPPNGVQPFMFPKFSSATGLVGDHTEGTEPTGGEFITTSQTVTPTAISGKASITREVWDMGGNPAVSTLIFNQMVRGWREGLESAAATFLNTLTAAADINLGVAVIDEALIAAWDAAVAGLQFERGYDFTTFVIERQLYDAFVNAVDNNGRKLVPQINPTDASGQAGRRFVSLDLAGVLGVPSWALATTGGAANNSWLFDPMFVHGWASTPQRLEFPGSGGAAGGVEYKPVAHVDLAIWGYKALANSDIGGVKQVIYDETV